ncbi:recombinase family protein [Escherichia coli]|nr:recombinase family protein [Escherichia coli]
MSRIFAYCRISTLDQTTENQRREIESAGFKIKPQQIIEEHISGSALMNPLMILVKIIKLRWIHILSYDQMVSRKINNQTTRCANSIFYTTLFTNSAPNYT